MTPEQFRRLAVNSPGAEEHEHHHHPDFRIGGKIFATMGFPDETRAMVKLTPEQQAEFLHDYPQVFSRCTGKWGEQGATSIDLRRARKAVIQRALEAGRQNAQWAALAAATGRGRPAPRSESFRASRRPVRTVTAKKKAAP